MKLGIAISIVGLGLAIPTSLAEEALPSVISLDYCADQYVLALADEDQILGLSKEARMVHSFYAERARGHKLLSGSAEEMLILEPDLAVSTWGGDARLFSLLEDQGTKNLSRVMSGRPRMLRAIWI